MLAWTVFAHGGLTQEFRTTRLENGLVQLESIHLQLITDMPLIDDVESLPRIFEQAFEQWCDRFQVDRKKTHGVQAVVYLMKDRTRFVQLDLVPDEVGNFRHGYQLDDRLFLADQPSDYYRRHLLLHEGTHWFLWKFHNGNGPPWYSEGICELLSTHDWDGQRLRLGVIPDHRDRFPFWGRLKLIRDSLENHSAPSLNAILSYSNTTHRTDEPYAWSWAAMLFFSNHPKHQAVLRRVSQPPLDYSNHVTIELKRALESVWPTVNAEWRVFVSELDFGFSPEHSMTDLTSIAQLPLQKKETRTIRCDRGWQSTGLLVASGQRVRFASQGQFVVRAKNVSGDQTDWIAEPQGITLEYHQGQPLGSLVATIVPIAVTPSDQPVERCSIQSIGRSASWTVPEQGLLLLKINEKSADITANSGTLTVTIEPDAS